MTLLGESEIHALLAKSAWRRDGSSIVREWRFDSFQRAIEFVNLVADAAQGANHHPDILVYGYDKVRLTLSTHSRGGLTEADFGLAARIDRLA